MGRFGTADLATDGLPVDHLACFGSFWCLKVKFVKCGQNVTVNRAEGRRGDDYSKQDHGGHYGVIILMMVFEGLLSHRQ